MKYGSIYILQDIEGKGKGLVATKNIAKGTRIISERPPFFSIIRTNALPIEENGTAGGIFLEACRINHCCNNNVQKHWNKRIGRHTVHPLRDIVESEDITIYYLGLDGIRDVHRQKLQDKLGFLCACCVCSLPAEESEENDQRLKRIQYLDDPVGRECMAMKFSERVLRYVDERIQLHDRQGPDDAGLPRAYLDAAQIAIANGDLARGRIFAERAVEAWRIASGPDSSEVIEYAALARNPATFSLYGLSMKWKKSLEDVPSQFHSTDFEHWLWRRDKPKEIHQSGQLTRLHRDTKDPYQPMRHWCFLGEITNSITLHHLELELADINDKRISLHFNTIGRGSELDIASVQNGCTVAVLYAERHTFTYGDTGIKPQDPQMLKIFPIALDKLLELSDRIQQCSGAMNQIKMCHGCDKKTILMNRCGKCSLFWYCDYTGWVERTHKTDCRILRDPDLRGFITLEWGKLVSRTNFPLDVSKTA
ncbi:hypothetical protein COCVIDRAFT_39748 [Bipolaris victoriae FI3]|uniref:SET domain-containing protein n=1 Tax=Bipolaris victoriae (strain FI3) TaxID=930091 RepID=W7EKC6_BIPV3|nr:hypothetical protein COCVIDRAFT_39748 [Bipolaris victoriae FI3]